MPASKQAKRILRIFLKLFLMSTRNGNLERELREYLQKDVTILREQRDGKRYYITLESLRRRLQAEELTDDEKLEWGGCGCFSDVGEEG